jgi:hypothetical protein
VDIATYLQRQCCSYFFLLFPGTSLALVLFTRYSAFSSRSLVSHHRSYAATTSPFSDTTCACAHYLFLRFLPLYLPYLLRTKDQRWTKEHRRNSQTEKVLFVKIAVSFPFLIPCLIPPSEHRANTERTPREERENFCTIFQIFCTIQKNVVPLQRKVEQ